MINIGNVVILGDSYSTFAEHIPEGYLAYYSPADSGGTDVGKVDETWWYRLMNETEGELILNSSYSGSTVCNTGYDGNDFSKISFVSRFDRLANDGFFKENTVDTLIIFGGTNDTWAGAPLGELKYEDQTAEELYSALPAIGYLFRRVREELPDTRVVCVLNTGLKGEIEKAFTASCEKYGAEIVALSDIDKGNGHPTVLGMTQIKEQILWQLENGARAQTQE